MPITPAEYIRQKTPVPAELRTAEWDAASAQAMERAFVMASVDNARILQAFQEQAARVAEGGASPAEARRALREALDAAGYTPEAGIEGTIKDLTSPRRMNVALEMNVRMAQGFAARQDALSSTAMPGWELYRARRAEVPRDWEARWAKAAREVNYEGVARDGSMIALVASPIWTALSAFGTPHPPFDWGSGMDVMGVPFSVCEELGLMTDAARPQLEQAAEAQRLESFNEDFELEPRISSRQMRARLAEDLAGIAEWDNEEKKLRLVDANGTRPYKWDEIGDVLTTPNKAGIPLLQLEAAQEWMEDSRRFAPPPADKPLKVNPVSLDMKEDFIRLVNRIEPTSSEEGGETVMRGLKQNSETERDRFLQQIMANGYGARDGYIAESWTNTETAARDYAKSTAPMVLVCRSYKNRKRFDGLYKVLETNRQDPEHPHTKEGESLFSAASRFSYVKHEERNGTMYVYVEEV